MSSVFVIMPFRPHFDHIYDAFIAPICKQIGLRAIRADHILEPGSIPDQVTNAIRDCLFVIADISEVNDNVFYELGYSHALHKRTILLSYKERVLPFDLRVSRTVIYDITSEAGRVALLDSLRSAVEYLNLICDPVVIESVADGQKLRGYMHTLAGRLRRLEAHQHFWFFAKREDLDTWWPQDNGEVRVNKDLSWTAQMWLGSQNGPEDIGKTYELQFGFLDTFDNREMTEFCITCAQKNAFPGRRRLPGSFTCLARIAVQRVEF
jgi:hypothetical protein